jgi:SAM-dependent methyltransferase
MTEYGGHRILEAMHQAVNYTAEISRLIETSRPLSATRILEFGAGDGVFVRKMLANGLTIDCVEPDTGLQRELAPISGKVFADITLVDSGSYDFIYTVNVVEHIAELDGSLREMHRVLNPQGTLFVFTPAFRVLWTSLDDEVGHVTRFTRRTLSSALTSTGFIVSHVQYFDALGFPAALGVRLMERLNLFRYNSKNVGFYDRHLFPTSRAMDAMFHRVLGKNVVAVAKKP